jgi:hypothetical protein
MSTEPAKLPILAESSDKNTLSDSVADGFFAISTGFGLLNGIRRVLGGIPPKRLDFNMLFNSISKPVNWFCKGGFFAWDSAIASGSGYPIRAIVKKSDNSGYWSNTVDNNATNPDAGGAGWETAFTAGAETVSQAEAEAGTSTTIRNWSALRVKQAIDALKAFPNVVLQTEAEAGTSAIIKSWTPERVKQAILALTPAVDLSAYALTSDLNNYSKLGVGQTWQDLTASRTVNTEYTNSTGKPIQVIATSADTGGSASIIVVVGGVTLVSGTYDAGTGGGMAAPCFIVPSGSTYQVACSNLSRWVELR